MAGKPVEFDATPRNHEALKLLSTVGLTRKEMAAALGYNVENRILTRCLVRLRFVTPIGNGRYSITDAGRKKLLE